MPASLLKHEGRVPFGIVLLANAGSLLFRSPQAVFVQTLVSTLAVAVAVRVTSPPRFGLDHVDPAARAAARLSSAAGVAGIIAVQASSEPLVQALVNLFALLASVASVRMMAHHALVVSETKRPKNTRETSTFLCLAWGVSALLGWFQPQFTFSIDLSKYAIATASLSTMAVLTLFAFQARYFETNAGALERSRAGVFVGLLSMGVALSASTVFLPERALFFGLFSLVQGLAAAFAFESATTIARYFRAGVVCSVCILAALVLIRLRHRTYESIGLSDILAISLTGAASFPLSERIFRRELSLSIELREALSRASSVLEPEEALRALLTPSQPNETRIVVYDLLSREKLWMESGLSLCRAPMIVPDDVLTLAREMPFQVLTRSYALSNEKLTLSARNAVAFLVENDLQALGVASDHTEALAAVGIRRLPRMLFSEECVLLELVTRRVASCLLAQQTTTERRAREALLTERLSIAVTGERAMDTELRRQRTLWELVARFFAHSGTPQSQSSGAIATHDRILRLSRSPRPFALVAPPGADVLPWAAWAHLESNRRGGPFLVIDGQQSAHHAVEAWRDDGSPLSALSDGTLVVMDAHQLPLPIQSYLGAAVAKGQMLIIVLPRSLHELVDRGLIHERLAALIDRAQVEIPTLEDRLSELAMISRQIIETLGARHLGRPMRLEDRALQALLNREWPGNDLELRAALLRAIQKAGNEQLIQLSHVE